MNYSSSQNEKTLGCFFVDDWKNLKHGNLIRDAY